MSITVIKYQNFLKESWDNFVNSSDNGTLFHKRDFLNYHLEKKFNDHSLMFYNKNKLVCIFPGANVGHENLILHSHPGASYGGFIFQKFSFDTVEKIIESFEKYLYHAGIREVFLVQPPSIYNQRYDETIEYSLKWNNYSTNEIYISSVIDLAGDPFSRINSRKKRYHNKPLEKGFELKWNLDFDSFYPILFENKKKHNVRPTHSLEELKKLSDLFPDNIKLLMLYKNGKSIGGTLNFVANNNVVIIFYNMIDYKYVNKQPAIHLICETMNWAKTNNFKWLDFGVSQLPLEENPLTPNRSLIQFKEQFGGTGFLRRVYRKKLN